MRRLGKSFWSGLVSRWPDLLLLGAVMALAVVVGTDHPTIAGIFAVGLIGNPIVPLTKRQLDEIVTPRADQPEVVPWILYDTNTFTSAATLDLQYFTAQRANISLSNMVQGAALTDPQYFQIWNLGFDILNDGTVVNAADETGIFNDIQRIMLVGQPVFTLTISDKKYGPFPLSILHTSGGAVGTGFGTFAASNDIQFANNSIPDGGWNWFGGVVIPPKVGFQVDVHWAAVQTLAGGNPACRFWMSGALYRKVV